ncbi:hypothetical protein G4V39_03800 [Thermosulfuriphilus ammonigenes]|uniref:Uncharacterized protein n=1 Tax=Thermosulfuriphilus ammonigenes TaxID=1936021 RepID=A0A6G7PVA8_9BACT|nr:hypothetical protein [Thermosulfuriphilus ammonigenes]MBA2848392.1 hypothetical protein [Thermosulfuriphilus ammonigenes]QIJ71451.1 hypothetical protein G4V39_03800 [Thermosulfuriphilus ammonigenes]
MRGVLLGLLAFLFLFPRFLWAGGLERINLSPFYFHQKNPETGVEETEILGPFWYSFRTREASGWALRPLASFWRLPQRKEFQFLYPLGRYWKSPDRHRFVLIPLFATDLDLEGEENPPRHRSYFPIFWGQDAKGRSYWGVFPFYGRMYSRAGKDEILFILWPLYTRSVDEGNITTTWLWPFFGKTEGPTEKGRRLWPLYGYYAREGEYEKSFFLWPFFFFERTDLYEKVPSERQMFFPFYIRERTANTRTTILLWPFFNRYQDLSTGYRQWDIPWPFFQYAEGPERSSRRLWPLIGRTETEESSSYFFLWPLYTYYFVEDETGGKEIRRFLLFSRFHRQWDDYGHFVRTSNRLWPLFRYERQASGLEYLYFPALFPFDDEGFERNWGPFFRLFEWIKDPRGYSRTKILWGIIRYESGPGWSLSELSFLLRLEKRPQGGGLSLLSGLFEIKKDRGRLHLKLFYLPVF